jgi:hypothetical protein
LDCDGLTVKGIEIDNTIGVSSGCLKASTAEWA